MTQRYSQPRYLALPFHVGSVRSVVSPSRFFGSLRDLGDRARRPAAAVAPPVAAGDHFLQQRVRRSWAASTPALWSVGSDGMHPPRDVWITLSPGPGPTPRRGRAVTEPPQRARRLWLTAAGLLLFWSCGAGAAAYALNVRADAAQRVHREAALANLNQCLPGEIVTNEEQAAASFEWLRPRAAALPPGERWPDAVPWPQRCRTPASGLLNAVSVDLWGPLEHRLLTWCSPCGPVSLQQRLVCSARVATCTSVEDRECDLVGDRLVAAKVARGEIWLRVGNPGLTVDGRQDLICATAATMGGRIRAVKAFGDRTVGIVVDQVERELLGLRVTSRRDWCAPDSVALS